MARISKEDTIQAWEDVKRFLKLDDPNNIYLVEKNYFLNKHYTYKNTLRICVTYDLLRRSEKVWYEEMDEEYGYFLDEDAHGG